MIISIVDQLYLVVARNGPVVAWAIGGAVVLYLADLAIMRFRH